MLFEVPQFDKEDTRNQYSPLEWELIDINKVDFTNKKPTEGLWHLLLLRKFSLKGLPILSSLILGFIIRIKSQT